MPKALPAQPHIDWLKKTAKARLTELRARDPAAKLHQAQRDVAEEYGFKSWRALKAHVDATSLDGRIIAATIEGNAPRARPAARRASGQARYHRRRMGSTAVAPRRRPWPPRVRRAAARSGGSTSNRRDRFDRASALHWAAGGGHLDCRQASPRVRRGHRGRRRRPPAGRAGLGHVLRPRARGGSRVSAVKRRAAQRLQRHRPRSRRRCTGHGRG